MLLLFFEYSFHVNFFSCFKLTSWWELDQPTKINKSREWIIRNVLGDLQNHFLCRSVKKCTCNFAEVQFQRKTEREREEAVERRSEGREWEMKGEKCETERVSEGKPKYPPLRKSCREMDERWWGVLGRTPLLWTGCQERERERETGEGGEIRM